MKRIRVWTMVPFLGGLVLLSWWPATMGAGAAESGEGSPAATGEKLFRKHCKTCHGAKGHGDGPRSLFLKPKPRNFAQPSQFKSRNDDELFKVIAEGGAPSGLSAAMPPWGSKLEPDQIRQLIAYIHSVPARESLARAKS